MKTNNVQLSQLVNHNVMRQFCFILFLLLNRPTFSQSISAAHIFNDTSLYFISQTDSLSPVSLSPAELTEIEKYLIIAIHEFNRSQQRYADSVNPEKKKRKFQALQIDINNYFFQLIPRINGENQKIVWIRGDCKDYFMYGKGKKQVYDPEWKTKFINGHGVADGGSCFIYLLVNLTLQGHNDLTMNGSG